MRYEIYSNGVYREMIAFLYKKLLVEEKQRLATEEQANIMISTMERSLAQLVNNSS